MSTIYIRQSASGNWSSFRILTIVDYGTKEVLLFEHRESIQSLAMCEEIRAFDAFRSSQVIVELAAGPEVRSLPPFLHRNHDWKPHREVRSGI